MRVSQIFSPDISDPVTGTKVSIRTVTTATCRLLLPHRLMKL